MRNFFTSLFGSLVALIIFFMGSAVLGFIFIVALAAMGGKKTVDLEKGSYLVYDMETGIKDAPEEFDASAIIAAMGGKKKPRNMQLRMVTRAIRNAATDDRIAGIYICGSSSMSPYGLGYAGLKEVRDALKDFSASGKPIKAYLNFALTKDYYVASVANEIVLDPYGSIMMPGLASEPMFLKGAFDKFGIEVQVTRVGKFKGAVEPFTRKDLSPENREQIQKLLDDVWGDIVTTIEGSRKLEKNSLQKIVDSDAMLNAESAKKALLVDKIAYVDEVYSDLKKETGRTGPKEIFKRISLSRYSSLLAENPFDQKGGKVAIVYAEGTIVDGEGENGQVGGTSFARELRRLRQDESVKAIVLRVNSPGGSATASEMIQREMRLAMEKKPVVVSMGSVAASGGYWISAYSNKIFAEPTTITGSIGVFGMMLNIKEMGNNLGLSWDSVKTGRYADMFTISRPKTPDEVSVIQRHVDWIYGQFLGKVAEGRKLDPKKVEEIAQGRVWSGVEAKNLGLVDEIGGLREALYFAANEAKLGTSFKLSEYPSKKDFSQAIAEALGDVKLAGVRNDALSQFVEHVRKEAKMLIEFNDPQGIYARMPMDLQTN